MNSNLNLKNANSFWNVDSINKFAMENMITVIEKLLYLVVFIVTTFWYVTIIKFTIWSNTPGSHISIRISAKVIVQISQFLDFIWFKNGRKKCWIPRFTNISSFSSVSISVIIFSIAIIYAPNVFLSPLANKW